MLYYSIVANHKSRQIEKYEKSSKLIDIVKKCKNYGINDKAIINTIEFETGKQITPYQLKELVELARKEVREQQIEVDVHMENMVKFGLYTDAMSQHEKLTTVENIIYTMIIEEAIKPDGEKNRNLILAMSNSLNKVFDTKDRMVTNIAFLTKTKAIWEQKMNDNNEKKGAPIVINKPSDPGSSGTETIKEEPKAAIMIKNQKRDVEELIEKAIDPRELEQGRVA